MFGDKEPTLPQVQAGVGGWKRTYKRLLLSASDRSHQTFSQPRKNFYFVSIPRTNGSEQEGSEPRAFCTSMGIAEGARLTNRFSLVSGNGPCRERVAMGVGNGLLNPSPQCRWSCPPGGEQMGGGAGQVIPPPAVQSNFSGPGWGWEGGG